MEKEQTNGKFIEITWKVVPRLLLLFGKERREEYQLTIELRFDMNL